MHYQQPRRKTNWAIWVVPRERNGLLFAFSQITRRTCKNSHSSARSVFPRGEESAILTNAYMCRGGRSKRADNNRWHHRGNHYHDFTLSWFLFSLICTQWVVCNKATLDILRAHTTARWMDAGKNDLDVLLLATIRNSFRSHPVMSQMHSRCRIMQSAFKSIEMA